MSQLPPPAGIDKPRSHGLALEQILHEVEAICDSSALRGSARLQRLLHYLVNETLAGRASEIKAYTIAVEVFDRGVDFDAGQDPYIRNLAVRLRKALAEFYNTAADPGPVRIEIPKGSYVPRFFGIEHQGVENRASDAMIVDRTFRAAQRLPGSPAVFLTSFRADGFDSERAHGLMDRIAAGLSRYSMVRVFGPFGTVASGAKPQLHRAARRNSPSSLLSGSLRRDGSRVRLSINLHDAKDGECLWLDQNDFSDEEMSAFDFEDHVAAWVCESLTGVGGALLRIAIARSKGKPVDQLSPYDAAARICCWGDTLDDVSFRESFRALEAAAKASPDSAALKAYLSDLYFSDYLSAIGMVEDGLERAEFLAREAAGLDPDSADAWWVLGQIHFCRDRHEAFDAAFERALTLNPSSVGTKISYSLYLAGMSRHEEAGELHGAALEITGHLPPFAHLIPFFRCLESGEFDEARIHAEALQSPGLVWGPLARAAAYAALDRKDDRAREAVDLFHRQPRFSREGPALSGRLIRSTPLLERVVAGIS